jgi:aspartate aminotransferase
MPEYLQPVKKHLSDNSLLLKETIKNSSLSSAWYQPYSAFYYLLDLSKSKPMKGLDESEDHSVHLCEAILEQTKVALVPTSDFGFKNGARISLVSESGIFQEALSKLFSFISE